MPDTTTHKVIAASTDCNSCWSDGYIAQKYDITTRENSGDADVLTKTIKLKYGKAMLEGYYAKDKICLSENSYRVDKQYIFLV